MHPERADSWRAHPPDHAVPGIGHFTKHTYAFRRLDRPASDAELRSRARASLHDVLDW